MESPAVGPQADDEERIRLVIEAVPNAMLMVSADGRIVLANAEAEEAFGYRRDELMHMHVEALVPERYRGPHSGYRDAYLAHPSQRAMGVGRELYGVRSDGSELPIEIGLNPIAIGGETYVLASIIDITERLRGQAAEEAVRHDKLRHSILRTMPFSIIATDATGVIVEVNPAAEKLLDRPQHELVGMPLSVIDAVVRPTDDEGSPQLTADPSEGAEHAYLRADGGTVPVSEAVVALHGEDGATTGYLAVAYDITSRVEARARVEHMNTHDALTGLANRSRLTQHLAEAFEQADRDGSEVTLLVLDLDHFKRVNDSLGHDVGDLLLQHVGERLSRWVRDGDLVARLGGDEFAVVFRGVLPVVDLGPRIEELLVELLDPVEVMGYELVVTASIGGATYPGNADSPMTLLRHADTALFRAKASGRDSLQWFDPSMVDETNEKLALSAALRQALGQGELSVVYQPQLDLASGVVVGVEALARWWSPELGPVSPERFIPVAEDSGMIQQLGEWVLRQSCADLALMQEKLGRPLRLAVNVSPRQLQRRTWLDQLATELAANGLEPEQLEIEITEGCLIDDSADASEQLTAVRELGVQVVVDDFGRGYSSLAYLTMFPIDKIKIDRSFVQPISSVDDDAAIVDAIIVMAHALGMQVVAEGVETAAQEAYLLARACDEVQGYLYSPGVPLDEIVEMAGRPARARPAPR
ncbi:MAG TPA: EAL domain-containing protein [Nocardioides sp.]|nr:EAL domain-containing protein [Nocardioides sp.]